MQEHKDIVNKFISDKAIDHSHKRFGKLTNVKYLHTERRRVNDRLYYKHAYSCECDCGNKTIIYSTTLSRLGSISCGCMHVSKKKASDSPHWRGCGNLPRSQWGKIIYGAKKRNIEFSIDISYGLLLLEKQKYRCAISGILLEVYPRGGPNKESTLSLDRIDSSKGYIEGNVQWVHKDINMMKQDFLQEEFIKYCKIISKHNT